MISILDNDQIEAKVDKLTAELNGTMEAQRLEGSYFFPYIHIREFIRSDFVHLSAQNTALIYQLHTSKRNPGNSSS